MSPPFSAILPCLLAGLLCASCTTLSPPERRIQKNPAMFDTLSQRDQDLVLRGEVEEGMSRDAVFLSWGRPGMVQSGSRHGKGKETWTWFGSTPVQTSSITFGGGYHPFYSHYGCHPVYGYGFGTGVDYIRHVERTVEFSNGKAVAWERIR